MICYIYVFLEIYTIATLTGHACLAVGDYTATVANGPYRKAKLDFKLQEAGEIIGDQFDVSTLRREDYEFHMGKDEQSDVLQVFLFIKHFLHNVYIFIFSVIINHHLKPHVGTSRLLRL